MHDEYIDSILGLIHNQRTWRVGSQSEKRFGLVTAGDEDRDGRGLLDSELTTADIECR